MSCATVCYFGPEAHDGEGSYYVDDEYPEEGSCGAFPTMAEAIAHAEEMYDVAELSPTCIADARAAGREDAS